MDNKKSQYSKKDLLLVLLIGVIVIIWFSNVIFSNNILVHRDLARYFYPLRLFGAESIKSFHIPFWNPYISCGKPFLATLQTGVFYPLSLVYYLSPSFDLAFNWYIIIHFFLAGLFMYCLMRYWKFCRTASFLSSIIFICGGYLSSVINMNTTLSSVIWLPVIFIFFDKALKTKKTVFVFLTAVFLGFQFLGGIPTPIYGTFWILFFYTLGFMWLDYREKRVFSRTIKIAAVFIAVFGIFIMLFMFQILPFKELLINSNLAGSRSLETASKWSLTPIELLAFIIPYIRGDINVPSGHLGPQEWLISFYVGIPAIILIMILFFLKRTKKAYFFGAVLLGAIFLALGKYTPVYPFLHRYLPGLSSMRYPAKFVFFAIFSLSILAGMGIEALMKENRIHKKQAIIKWLIPINLSLAVLIGLFMLFWQQIGDYFMSCFFRNKEMSGDLFNKGVYVYLNDSRYFCQFFIIFTITAFLIIVYFRKKMSRNIFAGLLILLAIGDLVSVNMGITKTIDRRRFALVPFGIRKLKEDNSMFRIFQTEDLWEINRSIFGLDYPAGMYDRKKTFASNTAMQYGIYYARGYGSVEVMDWYKFLRFLTEQPFDKKIKLLSFLNVKYILSADPIEEKDLEIIYKDSMVYCTLLNGIKSYKHFYIFKNPYCMERAFLADRAFIARNESVVLGIMQNEDFDPQEVVFLTEEPILDARASVLCPDQEEYVEIVNYEAEEVLIEAVVNKPKWLVLSDTYYPGWKVFVDGQEEKIYKANYF